MQAAQILTLVSPTYHQFFEAAADVELATAEASNKPVNIFQQFFSETYNLPQPTKADQKTKKQYSDEVFNGVCAVIKSLFEKVHKSLGEGANRGTVRLSSLSASWPEQSSIIRDLFQRYLNIELRDPQAKKRSPAETMLSLSWSRKDSKMLSDLLDANAQAIDSKTNDFRRSDRFCDCVLAVGGGVFSAHKVILSKRSPYFETMFSGPLQGGQQSQVIHLKDATLRADLFEQILEYIYTGHIQLQKKSHSDLILIAEKAKMLLLPKLEFLCNRLLLTKFSKETWGDIAMHALSIKDGRILKAHAAYFLTVSEIKEYVEKSIESLESLQDICEQLELTKQYQALKPFQKQLETRIEESLSKETLAHYCELGLSLAPSTPPRWLLEDLCRKFVDSSFSIQEWLNEEQNGPTKDLYVAFLTGLPAKKIKLSSEESACPIIPE